MQIKHIKSFFGQHTWNILFIVLFGLIIYGCKRSGEKTQAEKKKLDSLAMQYRQLNDSVDVAWAKMIDDDNQKHQYMKRLLLEVSYTNNYNKQRFDSLNLLVDRLDSARYDQQSLEESGSIDNYDSLTFAVTNVVTAFAQSNPRYNDFPLMGELIHDINQKNDMILIYRIRYDGFVKERNDFIKKYSKKLRDEVRDLNFEPLPMFQLPG